MPYSHLEATYFVNICDFIVEWTFGIAALILLTAGLIGQAFEMRKIRQTIYKDEGLGSPNIFMNKKNFKWYAIIGIGIALWYFAEGI